jgi:hypothetical protein
MKLYDNDYYGAEFLDGKATLRDLLQSLLPTVEDELLLSVGYFTLDGLAEVF